MPKLERKFRNRRSLTFDEGTYLRIGVFIQGDVRKRLTESEARRWWADPSVRAAVMGEHMRHHALSWPSRPAAWWLAVAGEERPRATEPATVEALKLLELGELTDDELARLPDLIRRSIPVARSRVELDGPRRLEILRTLAERLGVEEGEA